MNRAVRAIGRVLRCHHADTGAQVRLAAPAGADGPALAQVNARFQDTPCRVQVQGPRGFIATFVADRLDRQIARLVDGDPRRLWPDPARPPLAVVGEPRPITRRKRCAPLIGSPADAIRVLDAMDYDAHLFTDADTGEDAVVFRAGPFGVRLARQHQLRPPASTALLPLTVHPHPTPQSSEDEAAVRLCRYGLPFLFFTDPADGRGRLLYRRYDGDLTLVSPVEPEGRTEPGQRGDIAS